MNDRNALLEKWADVRSELDGIKDRCELLWEASRSNWKLTVDQRIASTLLMEALTAARLGIAADSLSAMQYHAGRARNLLNACFEDHVLPLVVMARDVQEQHRKAGFCSAEQRAAERKPAWDQWQAEANRIRAAHPGWYKTAVLNEVAQKFGVTRQAVAKHVRVSDRVKK